MVSEKKGNDMPDSYQDQIKMIMNERADDLVKKMPYFAEKFFDNIRTSRSPRTRLQYAYDLKKFFDYLQGTNGFFGKDIRTMTVKEVLGVLSVEDMQEYIKTFTSYKKSSDHKNSYSNDTIARNISSLRSFFRYYQRIHELDQNICDFLDTPKIEDKQTIVLNKEQVHRLLKAVQDEDGLSEKQKIAHRHVRYRDSAILTLALGTGLRVSEIVGIDLDDIDFQNASLWVNRKGTGRDYVYFSSAIETALKDYINKERNSLSSPAHPTDALFLSMKHERMSPNSIEVMIKKYARRAGLPTKLSPHALRRTFGTALYEETEDIYLVADALHHKSIDTTKNYYARMPDRHKRDAARTAEDLFRKD